jgi:hypothetical protein
MMATAPRTQSHAGHRERLAQGFKHPPLLHPAVEQYAHCHRHAVRGIRSVDLTVRKLLLEILQFGDHD